MTLKISVFKMADFASGPKILTFLLVGQSSHMIAHFLQLIKRNNSKTRKVLIIQYLALEKGENIQNMVKIGQKPYLVPIGCPIFRFFQLDFSTLNLGCKLSKKTGVQNFYDFWPWDRFYFGVKGRYGVKISNLLDYVDIILYF